MVRLRGSRDSGRGRRILALGIILATVAIMGSILYLVYSVDLSRPNTYQSIFRLNIVIGHPYDNKTDVAQVPPGIGVYASYWRYHSLDQYGVDGRAPLFTLDQTGIIREQSTVIHSYTLGDFFLIWGHFFNDTCVQLEKMYCNDGNTGMLLSLVVNGQVNFDFNNYIMNDQDVLKIQYAQAVR